MTTTDVRLLDAHLHLWDPARFDYAWLPPALGRRFAVDEYRAAIGADESEVAAAIFVQAECAPDQAIAEVDWVTSLTDVPVRGIVARARLERGADVEPELEELGRRPLVVGVRRLLQDEPPGFGLRPGFLAGLQAVAERGWAFDACVRASQLGDVAGIAESVPTLRVVLDHLGKPPVMERFDGAAVADWRRGLRRVARQPNTVCKLSGLPAELTSRWRPDLVMPYLDVALEAFGPDRLLVGSDWPVSGPIAAWFACLVDWLGSWATPAQRDAALGSNAERVYRIGGVTRLG